MGFEKYQVAAGMTVCRCGNLGSYRTGGKPEESRIPQSFRDVHAGSEVDFSRAEIALGVLDAAGPEAEMKFRRQMEALQESTKSQRGISRAGTELS